MLGTLFLLWFIIWVIYRGVKSIYKFVWRDFRGENKSYTAQMWDGFFRK